jgi:hypothetical protein
LRDDLAQPDVRDGQPRPAPAPARGPGR